MADRNYVYLVEPSRDSALIGWQAALAGREAARANVVLIGPSTVEGFPLTDFDRTSAQVLARELRAKYPTSGIGILGGRGRIGVPSQGITPAIPSPLTFVGGAFDPPAFNTIPAFHIGANHNCWYTNVADQHFTFTLKPWETSFDIVHGVGTAGHATGGYYRINGGSAVLFSTSNGTNALRTTHVTIVDPEDEDEYVGGGSPFSGASIEVGCTGSGYFILSEIVTYAGDESKGIAVHGVGHSGYRCIDWSLGASTPGGWRDAIGNLDPDLIVIEAGANDSADNTAALFYTRLIDLISTLREVGGPISSNCPILIVAPYKASGLLFIEPWDNYVAQMRTVANLDSLAAFMNEGDRMPATDATATYGLYHTDFIHGNADGKAYATQSHLLAEALSFG